MNRSFQQIQLAGDGEVREIPLIHCGDVERNAPCCQRGLKCHSLARLRAGSETVNVDKLHQQKSTPDRQSPGRFSCRSLAPPGKRVQYRFSVTRPRPAARVLEYGYIDGLRAARTIAPLGEVLVFGKPEHPRGGISPSAVNDETVRFKVSVPRAELQAWLRTAQPLLPTAEEGKG